MLRSVSAALIFLIAGAVGCAGPPPSDPGGLAAAYAAAGRHDEAAREVEVAVRAHPRDPLLRQQAARIHEQAGNLPRAIGHLEVAIELAPEDAEVWIQLGELENRRENAADAYLAFRRAVELAPDDIRSVSGLALAADSLGFEEEASRAYARWAELEREQHSNTPLPPER
ncbi:tetratricopeptide repeat protein, partial [bacterium]|nr:tetratricopeptide repeat protein [bacterium]